jgi:hypothetical protein
MNMPQEKSNKLAKASEVYAENTVLRALINVIPYIGGSLDILFASKGQKIIQSRLTQILEDLKAEMNLLQEDMVDNEYLESEEWFDLVCRGFEAAAKTRDREKILLYSKVLRGAVTIQNREESSPEEYLDILAELTPKEIEVARVIYNQQSDRPQTIENELLWAIQKGWKQLSEQCSILKEDLSFVLLRLQGSGLIHEITGTYVGYEGGVYIITESFRKLMRYLGEISENTPIKPHSLK